MNLRGKSHAGLTASTGIECLGSIVWLMGHAKRYSTWSIGDVHRLIIPPLQLHQGWVLKDKEKPVGYVSWATLSQEAEAGYINGTRYLQPEDWNAGDQLWYIDMVAPFGHFWQLVKLLRRRGFPPFAGRYIRRNENGDARFIQLQTTRKKKWLGSSSTIHSAESNVRRITGVSGH